MSGDLLGGERDRRRDRDIRGIDDSLLFFFLLLVIIFCSDDLFGGLFDRRRC